MSDGSLFASNIQHPASNIQSTSRPLRRTALSLHLPQLLAIRFAYLVFAVRRFFILVRFVVITLKPATIYPAARISRRFHGLHRLSRDADRRTRVSRRSRRLLHLDRGRFLRL